MEQTSLWDFICERFICKRELAVIEAFAGYGSQLKALRYLQDFFGKDVIKYHHKLIIEWALNSIIAYADLHQDELPNYGIDYSKDLKKEEIAELLHKLGVSINYNKPAELPQLKRVSEDRLRLCYNSIIWSNNLVDISRVKGQDLNIDNSKEDVLFCWSFPCQDLSLAGTMSNLKKEHEINDDNLYDDGNRSNMIWQVVRILRECAELGYDHLPTIMMMENVTQIHSMDNIGTFNDVKRILEDLGYLCWDKDLSGVDFGIPQTRNRTFMICILKGKDGIEYSYKFPKKIPLKLKLKDMLEENVDEKYYLSEKQISDIKNWKAYEKPLEKIVDVEREREYSSDSDNKNKRVHIKHDSSRFP